MQNSQLIWARSSIASFIRGHGGLTVRNLRYDCMVSWQEEFITSHLLISSIVSKSATESKLYIKF
jgi:hypothetical protein